MRVAISASLAALVAGGSNWPPAAYAQAKATLATLSQTQKLALVHGYGGTGGYVGNVPATGSLPKFDLEDGPQGVADGVTQVTAWPSAQTVAMSWDRQAMYEFGAGMGQEQKTKGTNIQLAPGACTMLYCGGEDPFFGSQMVAPVVKGIQSNNIAACVKHFIFNNQETDRGSASSNVNARAAHELYWPVFASAVDAGVATAMCSYNRVNNTYACENNATLGFLKTRLGFDGYMMSDWGATHSTVPAANAGLDQEMPDSTFFGTPLATAVSNGQVPQARLDDMVLRMLNGMYAIGYQNAPTGDLNANAMSDAHNTLARTLSERATTLLKNDGGLLPISKAVKKLAVFGDVSTVTGGGSGGVNRPYVVSPFQGFYNLLNGNASRPVQCKYFNDTDFYQPGNPCVGATDAANCCALCTADSSCNAFTFVPNSNCAVPPGSPEYAAAPGSASGSVSALRRPAANGACWKKPDTTGNESAPGKIAGVCAPLPPGAVDIRYLEGTGNTTAAAELAAWADVAIVVVATSSSEGSDRANLDLPAAQNNLVLAILAAQKKTVVVARCPGACTMPWANLAPAILYELMPGQESGNALANIIFGNVNPSGKLPLSFPNDMFDTWLGADVPNMNWPGIDTGRGWREVSYAEELLVGYRWYDAKGIAPLWPFGHGLSYTTFGYAGLSVSGTVSPASNATVTFTLTNTGAVAGSEVAQLYVAFPASAGEPLRQLRGFEKIALTPGGQQQVTFTITAAGTSIWDVTKDDWAIVPGTFTAYVGGSSRNLPLSAAFTVTA